MYCYAYLFWTSKLPKQYVLNLMNINKLTFTIKIKFYRKSYLLNQLQISGIRSKLKVGRIFAPKFSAHHHSQFQPNPVPTLLQINWIFDLIKNPALIKWVIYQESFYTCRQYMNRRGGFNRPLDFIAWDNFHQGPLIDSHFICIMLNSAQNYIL